MCVTGSQRKSHAVSLWRDRGGATPAPSAGGPTPDREERRSLRNGRSAPACAAAPPLRASRIASAAEARLRGERGRCKVGARPLGVKWWPAALQGPGLRWSLADTPDACCINFHPGPRRLSHQAALGLGDPGDPPPTTPAAGQLSATREWGYWRGPGCGVLSRDGEMVGRCRGGAPTKCTPSPVSAEGWAHFPCLASVVHGPGGSVADLDHTASWACKTGRAALNRLYYGGCRMVCRWSF